MLAGWRGTRHVGGGTYLTKVVGDAQLVAGPVAEVAVRDQDLTHAAVDLVHFVVGTFLLVAPSESVS